MAPKTIKPAKLYTFDLDDNIITVRGSAYLYSRLNPRLLPLVEKYIQLHHHHDFPAVYFGVTSHLDMIPNAVFFSHHQEPHVTTFISHLKQRKVIRIDFTHIPHAFVEEYKTFLLNTYPDEAPTTTELFATLPHTIQISHQPSCCQESRSDKQPAAFHHMKMVPLELTPDNINTQLPGGHEQCCSICLPVCVYNVQTTAQYAEFRSTGLYFHKDDAYISFSATSSFFLGLFQSLCSTTLSAPDSNGVQYHTGMLPRNKAVYESIKTSYFHSKQQLAMAAAQKKKASTSTLTAQPNAEYNEDGNESEDEEDDETNAVFDETTVEKQTFRFLNAFSCYDDEVARYKDKQHFLTGLSHSEIVTNLAWMFEPDHVPHHYETIHNTGVYRNVPNSQQQSQQQQQQPSPPAPPSERYGHFIQHPCFGPSVSRLLDALLQNHKVTIITSRGQGSWAIQRGILIILMWMLDDQQLDQLTIPIGADGYYCLCDFVSHLPIYTVHSGHFLEYSGHSSGARTKALKPHVEEIIVQRGGDGGGYKDVPTMFLDDLLQTLTPPPQQQDENNTDSQQKQQQVNDPQNMSPALSTTQIPFKLPNVEQIKTLVSNIFNQKPHEKKPETQKCIAMLSYLGHVKLCPINKYTQQEQDNNKKHNKRQKQHNSLLDRENFVIGNHPAYHPKKRTLFGMYSGAGKINDDAALYEDEDHVEQQTTTTTMHTVEEVKKLLTNNFYTIDAVSLRYKMGAHLDNTLNTSKDLQQLSKIIHLNSKEKNQFKCYCHVLTPPPPSSAAVTTPTPMTTTSSQVINSMNTIDVDDDDDDNTTNTLLNTPTRPKLAPLSLATPTSLTNHTSTTSHNNNHNDTPVLVITQNNTANNATNDENNYHTKQQPQQQYQSNTPQIIPHLSLHHSTQNFLTPALPTPNKNLYTPSKRKHDLQRRMHQAAQQEVDDFPHFYSDEEDEEEEEPEDDYNTFPSTPYEETTPGGGKCLVTAINTETTVYETDVSESETGSAISGTSSKSRFGGGDLPSIHEANKYKYCLGFSDDDRRNVDAMEKFFVEIQGDHEDVKFVLYDTSKAPILYKKVITRNK